jgi:hypothetical protein
VSATLDEIRRTAPGDAEAIEAAARAEMYFFDGPGVILPSGRRCTGEEMRALVAEAAGGFIPAKPEPRTL